MIPPALLIAVPFILPTVVTWLVLDRWWPGCRSGNGERLLRLSLTGPLSAGCGSLFFFLWSFVFTPVGSIMVLVHAGLLLSGMIVLVSQWNRKGRRYDVKSAQIPICASVLALGLAERVLGRWACAITAGLALCGFASCLLRNPHGAWDAWAIWNLRARFLYRSGLNWADSFSPDLFWSSPDYPLGLPGFVALTWKYVGSETVVVPMLVAALFTVATGAMLYASLRSMAGSIAATLALLILAGTPLFLQHGASQYADVPVGFFFLASIVLMALYDRDPDRCRGWLILVGITGSLAAWTKNEGLLFLAAFATARIALAVRQREWRRLGREARWLLVGAAPVLTALLIFKSCLAPPSGFFAIQNWETVAEKLMDWSRYRVVASAFFREMSTFGGGMSLLAIVSLFLVGVDRHGFRKDRWLSGALVLGIMLMGYFFIYIITPQDLGWHLRTSLSRLLLQLWPLTIFLVYLNLKGTSFVSPKAR
jgi:hypothetical protein